MALALEEARKGQGRTSPNPLVGAVIVKEGRVVGRGYHKKAGTPHAEINALADAQEDARDATLYVTLEPCNHTGKTPPCTGAILRAGIRNVVIGMADPNPHVVGGGGNFLRSHGVSVIFNVLEQQCRDLNRPFIKLITTGTPWVIMKAGVSLDGKIAFFPQSNAPITGRATQQIVHRLRDQSDAILIGVETALIDDPRLTTRIENQRDARDPLRVVLDSRLRLPVGARLLTQHSQAPTLIFCGEEAAKDKETALVNAGAIVVRIPSDEDNRVDLSSALNALGQKNIMSVLVEGGSRIHGAFWKQTLVDELFLFYAPFVIGDQGVPLVQGYSHAKQDALPMITNISVERVGNDTLMNALVRPVKV